MCAKQKLTWLRKIKEAYCLRPWVRFSTHLVAAIMLFVGLLFMIKFMLDVVTRHDEQKLVPDFTNMTVQQAAVLAAKNDLVIEVVDSVCIKRMRRGAVYRQNPEPSSVVKSGRRIVLTINSVTPRKIMMPDLRGLSMRQAKAEILSRGLRLGEFIYVQDMATNNVLSQEYRGEEIAPGTLIDSESVIDLVLGMNGYNLVTYIPDVRGQKFMNAVDAVRGNSLNVAKYRFDDTVKNYEDTLSARVYKLYPEPSDSISVRMGTSVTLYMTLDDKKIVKPESQLIKQQE